jgi:hypothetical protein
VRSFLPSENPFAREAKQGSTDSEENSAKAEAKSESASDKKPFEAEAKQGAGVKKKKSHPGWAERFIPGWRAASSILPPPTEARIKWDERQKRQNSRWEDDPLSNDF